MAFQLVNIFLQKKRAQQLHKERKIWYCGEPQTRRKTQEWNEIKHKQTDTRRGRRYFVLKSLKEFAKWSPKKSCTWNSFLSDAHRKNLLLILTFCFKICIKVDGDESLILPFCNICLETNEKVKIETTIKTKKAPTRFELVISCLLDRRFNQLSHGATYQWSIL